MAKIVTHTPSKEHEHEILHAHVDFEAKTITYQLAVGAPAHRAALSDELAAELLAVIGDQAQAEHDEGRSANGR